MSDTPKTDAAAYAEYCPGAVTRLVVPADFARAQERTIAELESDLAKLQRAIARIIYDCKICGGIVDLANAIKPTAKVGPGRPMKGTRS